MQRTLSGSMTGTVLCPCSRVGSGSLAGTRVSSRPASTPRPDRLAAPVTTALTQLGATQLPPTHVEASMKALDQMRRSSSINSEHFRSRFAEHLISSAYFSLSGSPQQLCYSKSDRLLPPNRICYGEEEQHHCDRPVSASDTCRDSRTAFSCRGMNTCWPLCDDASWILRSSVFTSSP